MAGELEQARNLAQNPKYAVELSNALRKTEKKAGKMQYNLDRTKKQQTVDFAKTLGNHMASLLDKYGRVLPAAKVRPSSASVRGDHPSTQVGMRPVAGTPNAIAKDSTKNCPKVRTVTTASAEKGEALANKKRDSMPSPSQLLDSKSNTQAGTQPSKKIKSCGGIIGKASTSPLSADLALQSGSRQCGAER